MIGFLKRFSIVSLIVYGCLYYFVQINFFNFKKFKVDDTRKTDQNYYQKLFSFLENQPFRKAFTLRDGEFLTYSNLNILHVFDDKAIDLIRNQNKLSEIDCIIANNYNDPVFYHSSLKDIMFDFDKSDLVFDDLGYKVFSFKDTPKKQIITEFEFKASNVNYFDETYQYVTHREESPLLSVEPDPHYAEFPSLEKGVYDCLCDITIEAPSDAMVSFSINQNQEVFKDTFFLKKGVNDVKTRFLAKSDPFRCVLYSKKHPIQVNGFKVKFVQNENYNYELSVSKPRSESGIIDTNFTKIPHTLFYRNKEGNIKKMRIKIDGDGFLRAFPIFNDYLIKLLKINILQDYLLSAYWFFSNNKMMFSIGAKVKTIEVKVPPQSALFLEFTPNPFNEKASFKIHDLDISIESETR